MAAWFNIIDMLLFNEDFPFISKVQQCKSRNVTPIDVLNFLDVWTLKTSLNLFLFIQISVQSQEKK